MIESDVKTAREQNGRQAQRTYELEFVTPAFLGAADQSGQWRTPPIKALIRQWWRLAVARHFDYQHGSMRRQEGLLFGHAWLEDDKSQDNRKVTGRKSLVRLRLAKWHKGSLESPDWPGGPMENVTTTRDGKGQVRSDLYLGFGPILPPSKKQGRTDIEIQNAIGVDQHNELRMAYPEGVSEIFAPDVLMSLVHLFGTVGSRSRNGWGSLAVNNGEGPRNPAEFVGSDLWKKVSRPWRECLGAGGADWPHAFGDDEAGPLIWSSEPLPDWRKAMGRLAKLKVEIRRAAKDITGPQSAGGIQLLGYPAGGKWDFKDVDSNLRLGSPIRFKVIPADNGKLTALAYHLPCNPAIRFLEAIGPARAKWLLESQESVWKAVHAVFDDAMQRVSGGTQ